MNPTFFPTPAHLRKWLEKNHRKKDELWIGMYKLHTGKPSVTWQDIIDQVLCFGWIDGIRKSIDNDSYVQRITPRRKNSIWSAKNIKSFNELKAKGLMTPAGEAAFIIKKENTKRYSFEQAVLELPPEFEKKFKANKKAWAFLQSLPPSVKKPTIWWIISAKQEETKKRRLDVAIACSEKGERIPSLVVVKMKR